jgi:hypothetical protein
MRKKNLTLLLASLGILFAWRKPLWCSIRGHLYPKREFLLGRWAWVCPSCRTVRGSVEAFVQEVA